MNKNGFGKVDDFAMSFQSFAEFSIFAIEKESFIKLFFGAEHEAGTHDLVYFVGAGSIFYKASGLPVRTEDRGVWSEFFK